MIQQFIKFCIVGGSGVFVDFGITYLCKEWLKFNKYIANSLGFFALRPPTICSTAFGLLIALIRILRYNICAFSVSLLSVC